MQAGGLVFPQVRATLGAAVLLQPDHHPDLQAVSKQLSVVVRCSVRQIQNLSTALIPTIGWSEFLEAFSSSHARWLVTIETYDRKTGETVSSRFEQLQAVQLDCEDEQNPRINVLVQDGNKQIKRILFRPTTVMLEMDAAGNDEALQITSVNTVTTLRFRVTAAPEEVDGLP